jgi:pimeloyl-ACP methyl ester carboxylesterase
MNKYFSPLVLAFALAASTISSGFVVRNANAQSSPRPYVVLVNGYQDCCVWDPRNRGVYMGTVVRELQQRGAEFRLVPWDTFRDGAGQRSSTSNDAAFLQEAADFINNRLDPNRPLILIGHSFGGDSLLSLAPRINRRIQFLGVIDPTAAGGLREPVTRRGVPANVDYFFNRWEQNALALANVVPFDSRLVNGSISGCRARSCDQQEQSLARREDGSEIRIACESWEVTCKGYNPIPVTLGGSNGTKAKRLAHNDMPLDAYLQRQMADRINQVLTASQSVVREASTGRPVLTLTGNFKGSGTSRAIFFDRGNARTAIEVDGRTWYDSGSRNFIFNQTQGRCVVGNFSGSGRGDIACLYDYGNFDVGVVVFVSNGRVFEESVWWRSGPRNFNPDAVEGSLAVIQGPSGRSNIRFTYRYPENVGSVTLVSSGSKFNVVVER